MVVIDPLAGTVVMLATMAGRFVFGVTEHNHSQKAKITSHIGRLIENEQ